MAEKLTLGDLIWRLGYESEAEFLNSLERVLGKAEGEAKRSGQKAGKSFGQNFKSQFKAVFSGAAVGSFLGTIVADLFRSAASAAKQFAEASVREFATYEQGLIQLRLAGEENLAPLEARITSLARETRVFSRTDISLAIGQLVKAGYDAETAFALVEQGAKGAASEVDPLTLKFGDLGNTSVQLGNILRALQYDVSQSGRVMDVLARGAQDSNLDVSDLVEIIAEVGPTARLAGLEIEDLAAMAAVLSNNGQEASTIGTGLRSVLNSLIRPPASVRDEFDRLGVSLVDRNGEIRDVNDVLKALGELADRGGSGLQTLASGMDTFALSTAASLGSASGEVERFRGSMDEAEGSAEELASAMRDSGAGAAAEMEARMADARVELGEKLMPVMIEIYESVLPTLVEWLDKIIDKWTDWYFLIHGTTPELERMQREFDSQFTEEQLAVLEHIQQLQREKADLQREIDDVLAGVGKGGPSAVDADDRLYAETLREEIAKLDEQIRLRRAYYSTLTGPSDQGSSADGGGTDTPPPPRPTPTPTPTPTRSTSGPKTDPLIDEARRVAADQQRLKLLYEQGEIDLEEYVEQQEAHLRRLNGLYEKVSDPDQMRAVLQARKVFYDELERLDQEHVSKQERLENELNLIEGNLNAFRGEEAEQEAARREAAYQERQRRQREAAARNNQRMLEALTADEQAYYDWLEQQEAERVASQQGYLDELSRIEGAQLDWALEQETQKRERAERERREREEKMAEARANNNQRLLGELMAQEAAYTAWLEQEAEKRAEREEEIRRGHAFRAEREGLAQALANLNLEGGGSLPSDYVTVAERAEGAVVRLTEAQRALGLATREDVIAAVEEQIGWLEKLIPIVDEGSDRYYLLVAALEEARRKLEELNSEDVRPIPVPKVTAEVTDEGQAYLREKRQLESDLEGIALSFPRAIYQGIRQGDIGEALKGALGSATDFFVERMIEGILGPIAENLAKTASQNLFSQGAGGAMTMNPAGLILGGGLLLATLLFSGRDRQREERERSSRSERASGAPSITYNLSATVNVDAGRDFSDPAFYAKWRNETEALVIGLLHKTKKEQS